MKPVYVEALWHNCNMCRIHYMSESPHIRAYLCDECWNKTPHFNVEMPKVKKGPTHNTTDFTIGQIVLYTIGNRVCLAVIGYFLLFK